MSATTQTAESPKQAPAARPSPTNGARRPNKTAPTPSVRADTPAPVAKVKVPAPQTARAPVALSPHPLVQGLFQTFPEQGADISDAKAWMDTANAVLKQILKFPGGLTVTAMPSAA